MGDSQSWMRRWAPARWKLWTLGRRTALYLVVWDLAAVAVVLWSATHQQVTGRDLVDLVVLAVLAVGYDELSRRIENQRLGVARGTHVSMRSVWSIVGAAMLPMTMFAVLAAVIYVHASAAGARDNARVAPNRALFNAASMVVSAAAAAVVLGSGDRPFHAAVPTTEQVVLISVAALAYFVVNTAAVAGALTSLRGRPQLTDLGTGAENLLELGTLGIGAAAAFAASPWAVLLTTPVMYLLQRSALVDELEAVATQDSKTGLLNAAAWRAAADRELHRAHQLRRPLGVLVVDLDLFKQVNDRHGHLTGDAVLAAAAACLTSTLRDADLVGRFGGEEFVAVLPGLDVDGAVTAAERVRVAIAETTQLVGPGDATVSVGVTASVGVATAPAHGVTITELLAAADVAMYEAKRLGRNRVVAAVVPGDAAY